MEYCRFVGKECICIAMSHMLNASASYHLYACISSARLHLPKLTGTSTNDHNLLPNIRKEIFTSTAEAPSTSRLTLLRRRITTCRRNRCTTAPPPKVLVWRYSGGWLRKAAEAMTERRRMVSGGHRRATPCRKVARHGNRWRFRRGRGLWFWSCSVRCGLRSCPHLA